VKALLKDGRKIGVLNHPRPTIAHGGHVRLQVAVAGLCRSDLLVAQGSVESPSRIVLGHECSGTILEVGEDVLDLRVGQRVTVFPWKGCNFCQACSHGMVPACSQAKKLGTQLDGVFAEEVVAEQTMVFPLPEEVSFQIAVLAEPLASARAVLRSGILPQQRGCLIEHGFEDELTLRVLRTAGYKIETLARSSEFADGQFDFIVESRANQEEAHHLLRLLKPGGQWVTQGHSPPLQLDLRALVSKEIRIVPVNYGNFAEAVTGLADPQLELDSLLGNSYTLEDWPILFAEAEKTGREKLLLRLQDC